MTVEAKICGINDPAAMDAAVAGGAWAVGLVFYPPSPRFVGVTDAAALVGRVPEGVRRVGLFVDADDETVEAVLAEVALDMLQLHGGESPERVAALRARFGRPVMKAVKVAAAADLDAADAYFEVADMLLFDAKAPPDMAGALPGGNALRFDWRLIEGRDWPIPWMLSGGLTPENLAEAVRRTGARRVDVSSGVEDRPGRKSVARIAAFLAAARRL